ncbi:MAG: plasmid partitioning protein RepA [Alphaproteobacteria bacterium]|jgi:chromosome partitioning protein|uniref:Chromosome partitioning protein n=1 Tax=Loktanella salsilacus TaxID=195913 RepID=A0A1I4ILG0_9RHOB|nr:plasmid partitioning protein RepA [Loktanella salsilacus]MBU0860703.1 plasmid partitioning protein RepA [Alphaproteobacteria bacterium]MBU1835231.1 plasmid partitioning protein RepA [Alphaproteobacteria bacterium]SFL55150.1 chromosome partitioning protein [Loktanella salsilacus]|tara:strand:- start:957 stop:2159 length:1203 start_codon:yes stop_codon:yes gene_type:complete
MHSVLHDKLREDAERLSEALEHMSKLFLAPKEEKTLRSFATPEVAELLRVSDGYLRKAHFDGRIPEVEQGANNKRLYTAENIIEIRHILAQNAKDPLQFLPGRRPGDKLQIWSTVNFKGGSSKTTTTISLGMRLAMRGYRVLLLDSDPQASLTTFFGYQPEIDFRKGGTLYDAIRYNDGDSVRVPIVDVLKKTYFPNLDIVPGGIMLSEFETETPMALSRGEQPVFFNRIRDSLRQVEDDYDIVLIDCPPQLGYLTMSAVCASTSLLMTIIPERVDLASASQFLTMASGVLEVLHTNGGIGAYDNFAYLLTRFDTAISTQQDLSEWMRELLGDSVIKTPFVKSSAVSEAGLSQKTIFEVDLSAVKNRKTYERALESVIGFSNDIEIMIQNSWGRGDSNET